MTKFKDVPKGRYFVQDDRPFLRISKGVTGVTEAFDLIGGTGQDFCTWAEVEVVTFRNLATRFGALIDENLPFFNSESPAAKYRAAMDKVKAFKNDKCHCCGKAYDGPSGMCRHCFQPRK